MRKTKKKDGCANIYCRRKILILQERKISFFCIYVILYFRFCHPINSNTSNNLTKCCLIEEEKKKKKTANSILLNCISPSPFHYFPSLIWISATKKNNAIRWWTEKRSQDTPTKNGTFIKFTIKHLYIYLYVYDKKSFNKQSQSPKFKQEKKRAKYSEIVSVPIYLWHFK